jgi:cadmium resistance protein CadD (predicted permease)
MPHDDRSVNIAVIEQAIGLFTVTNIDDIAILALFFGQAIGRTNVLRIVIGQYLGFAAILAASILGALGLGLLPETALPYLGLLPLILGAAFNACHDRPPASSTGDDRDAHGGEQTTVGPGALAVAAVTLADGGDI